MFAIFNHNGPKMTATQVNNGAVGSGSAKNFTEFILFIISRKTVIIAAG